MDVIDFFVLDIVGEKDYTIEYSREKNILCLPITERFFAHIWKRHIIWVILSNCVIYFGGSSPVAHKATRRYSFHVRRTIPSVTVLKIILQFFNTVLQYFNSYNIFSQLVEDGKGSCFCYIIQVEILAACKADLTLQIIHYHLPRTSRTRNVNCRPLSGDYSSTLSTLKKRHQSSYVTYFKTPAEVEF